MQVRQQQAGAVHVYSFLHTAAWPAGLSHRRVCMAAHPYPAHSRCALALLYVWLAVQAAILLGGSSWVAGLWGVPASSPLWGAAAEFLNIRAVGAPVTVLLLVMQVGAGGVGVV